MRILHLVKHFLNPGEEWLRNLLRFSSVEVEVGTLLVLPHAHSLPGLQVETLPGPRSPGQQLPEPSADQRRWLQRFDVVHVHFMDTAWTLLPWLGAAKRVVISVYGYDLTALPTGKPEWRERYAEVLALVPHVVVQGPAGIARVGRWGADERVHVVPLGIPTDQILERPPPRAAGPVQFLQAAHYREKKGHRDTIEAFDLAFGRSGRAHLTLVGDRPMSRDDGAFDAVRRRIARSGLGEVVSMTPSVTHVELMGLMDAHDVYVQPSRTTPTGDVEGGPVAVLDAQSRGRPVLSTLHENIPTLVDDGQSGLLTPEADPSALAESMCLAADVVRAEQAALGLQGLAVARRSTSEATGVALRAVYEGAIK